MNNFIYVDIDGPLLPGKCLVFPENMTLVENFDPQMRDKLVDDYPPRFDPLAVQYHNLLVELTGAEVVISSNWRRWVSIDRLKKLFADQGLKFNYAQNDSLTVRGFSSERVHDVASHLEDFTPENSRVLVIDDHYSLEWLERFYNPDENSPKTGKQILEKKNITYKWIRVDYQEGMSYRQFQEGLQFLLGDSEHQENIQNDVFLDSGSPECNRFYRAFTI